MRRFVLYGIAIVALGGICIAGEYRFNIGAAQKDEPGPDYSWNIGADQRDNPQTTPSQLIIIGGDD